MTKRIFFGLLAATLVFRFWLAAAMPMTGDEAYFFWWGKVPDWGFYDHPPMVGWWLAALLLFFDAEWWLRLPAVLLPAILALGAAWTLRSQSGSIAWGAATLVLLAPANVWNVFITTDTPLIYFSFFSALAFLQAARDDDWRYYLLSGLLLAGAVLSKYFAALLGVAYLLHALVYPNRRKWTGLLLCYVAVLPALALMAWWNADHCWANIMFNVFNRHGDAGWSWKTPLLYAVMMLYLLTPPVLWLFLRRWSTLRTAWTNAGDDAQDRAMYFVAFAPLALFALLSLVKQIGLHWVLSFVPFVLIALAQKLEIDRLRRVVRFFVGFALVHIAAILVIAQLSLETWKSSRIYDGIVLTFDTQKLLAQLKPYERDYVFASDGYSNAVTYGYNAKTLSPRYFLVFGQASSHARHDDILTDFRSLDGKNILILRKSSPGVGEYAPYFREVEIRTTEVRGATFHFVLGRGFNYPAYRDRILSDVRAKYYAVPSWLPQRGCYFCDRYFQGQQCRK